MRSVLSVSLPEKIAQELEAYARETGRNKSDIVRESISLYLWEARIKRLKRKLKLGAKRKGMVTEEDVFREIS
ncbi:MAG: CopG family transcriptional regulator [Deltaproteobacteria bacterium]|nr:MAG: CopG family transcriptional regulator [Deltaproteobacteria bacterium]